MKPEVYTVQQTVYLLYGAESWVINQEVNHWLEPNEMSPQISGLNPWASMAGKYLQCHSKATACGLKHSRVRRTVVGMVMYND